jgi:hypothetical protein
LDILEKYGSKKPVVNPPSSPNLPPPTSPDRQEQERKNSTLLNELKSLNQKSVTEIENQILEENNKPVELPLLQQYFEKYKIESITLKDSGELVIKFQNQTNQTVLADNQQLRQVKQYLRQEQKKFLSRKELFVSQNSNTTKPKFDYLP